MVKSIDTASLAGIEALVRRHPGGVTSRQIADALRPPVPLRTLQHRLRYIVTNGRLVMEGERRWARYHAPGATPRRRDAEADAIDLPLSTAARSIQTYVRGKLAARKPVGYDRALLDAYRPGRSFYLTAKERAHLREVGTSNVAAQPAGTYAKLILNRLLIDLSWNSSRLEGNTFSLLETRRLIDFGEEADGKDRLEAQMVLNHKDVIEFLVGEADEIGFNRYTILNLHALLANNLLADPDAPGRLRRIGVGIEGSAFHPLEAPRLIEACFDQILATAVAIADPFDQAFFAMVRLPYLRPFDDVNKRVSRLAANIPLIRGNLSPLSFDGVPRRAYTEAVLGVYELRRRDMLKELFIWAYERSAARYAAIRQSLGEPDPFRLRHRDALRAVVSAVVGGRMGRKRAVAHIDAWTKERIKRADRERFREIVERELIGLHEGNFARYRIRPSEFAAWRDAWKR